MPASQDPRQTLGRAGEKHAERFLKKKRYHLLARRYSTPFGEIDLIMRDSATIVFVEVKTRRDRRYTDPEEAVRADKIRRMTRTARTYLKQKRIDDAPARFDVVSVILPAEGPPEIEHFEDAFPPSG